MTNEEKQEIISAVLSALRTNSKTISQLTAVSEMSDDDYIELNGGRKVSYAVLMSRLDDALNDVVSTSELEQVLDPYATSTEIFDIVMQYFSVLDSTPLGTIESSHLYQNTLHWAQSPIVFLASMGATLDDVDGGTFGYTPAEGELNYRPDSNAIFVGSSTTQGFYPKQGVVYVNMHTMRFYKWTGSAMQEIGDTAEFRHRRVISNISCSDLTTMAIGEMSYFPNNHYLAVRMAQNKWFTMTPDPETVYVHDGATIVWNETSQDWTTVGANSEAVEELLEYFGSVEINDSHDEGECTENGYIKYQSPGDVNTAYSGFRHSDYIAIPSGATQFSWTQNYGTAGKSSGLAFYNAQKVFISGVQAARGASETGGYTYTDNIPTGAKYARFTVSDNVTDPISTLVFTGTGTGLDAWEAAFKAEIIREIGGGSGGGGETPTVNKPLRILAIGNSFTKCTMTYVGDICSHLGVKNVTVQRLYADGSSLADWCGKGSNHNIDLSASRTIYDVVIADGDTRCGNGTLAQILNHNWDYIMLQQASTDSDDYSTYEPYLSELIDYILKYCPNKGVRFIWNMTWETSAANYNDQDNRLTSASDANPNANIIRSVKLLKENYGHLFDYIVPCGTAIENIRNSSVNGSGASNFTRDNSHLNMGVGDYVAGCTFYAAVLQPFTGKHIYDDTTVTNGEHDAQSATGAVDVTDANRLSCHKSAVYAVIHPWAPTNIDNL